MNLFHAHIYVDDQNLDEIHKLSTLANLSNIFIHQEIYKKPIGPHPLGMLELHFNDQFYSKAIEWLKNHHNNFSTLIHKDTGDDVRDHTENILWLGTPLKIDFSFFELIKKYPELRIH